MSISKILCSGMVALHLAVLRKYSQLCDKRNILRAFGGSCSARDGSRLSYMKGNHFNYLTIFLSILARSLKI